MWDFSIGGALGAMAKTAPFIVVRMLVYFGIALLYVFATGGGGAIGYGFTSFGDGEGAGALYGALFGFAGASGFLYWAREYILYIVKAGHIAVLVHVYDGKALPEGRGQVDYAAKIVKERFTEANLLFVLDRIIKGVIRVLTGIVSIVGIIPGLDGILKFVKAVIRMSLTYVDEIILAYNIRTESENPWESSRQALVLYGQNYPKFLKNAVWLSILVWVLTLVIFIVLLGPILGLMSIFPGNIGFVAFVVAFIFAWSVKAALIEPVAMYALMEVYFKTVEGQEPDPAWDARLEQASVKFRELKERAVKAAGFGGKAAEDKPAGETA